MAPVRVAYLFEFPTLLGGEHSWLAMTRAMADVAPVVVAPPKGDLADRLRAESIPLIPYDWPPVGPEGRAEAVRLRLLPTGVDLVHGNSLTTSLCVAGVAAGLGVPGVGHCRDVMGLSRARVARLNRLHRLVAVSAATAEHLVRLGVDPGRVDVVRNGIDGLNAFDPDRVSDRLHDVLGLPRSTSVVGFVGQLVQRKDPLTFVRAIALAAAQRPDLRAVVIGERYSNKDEAVAYERELQEAAGPETIFLGRRDDVPSLMRGMAAVVSSSRQDPLSRVLLEASALARPVVATDVGGTREIVDHGTTGLVVPPADPENMAAAILDCLGDPESARRFGEAARAKMLDVFTVKRCAHDVRAIYGEVLGRETDDRAMGP